MTTKEFSDEFDVLASSYLREGGFTLSDSSLFAFNEYEKSLFLTQAQEQYVLAMYNGKNPAGDSFERTEEMRRYLHNLVGEYTTDVPLDKETYKDYLNKEYKGMSGQFVSTLFLLPEDLWFITYESVQTVADSSKASCDGGLSIIQDVVPVTQDEFHRIKRNPFRGPTYHRALRLDLSDQSFTSINSGVVEIISKYPIDLYYVRYIRKLKPIILVNLPDGLKIEGENTEHQCVLHEAVHRDILRMAVRLALSSRPIGTDSRENKDND
jgi:hypothetical protein